MADNTNALGIFLSKFNDWKYCPPSDHLWTVSFLLAPRDGESGATFKTLYENILKVNGRYDKAFSPLWKLKMPDGETDFILNSQDETIGLFLINELNFNGNSVQIQDSQSTQNSQFTGWLSFGKTMTGRNHNHAAKIKFAQTNWNFIEIFIDRWIAAIGQQGLIEDSTLPNIKSNIIITEYAAAVPFPKKSGVWTPKKKITLLKAFPKNRFDNKYTYDPDEASAMKYNVVDFEFDAYQVEYFDVGITKVRLDTSGPKGGTPGWISPSTAVGTSEVGPTLTAADIEGRYTNSK